MVVRHGVFVFFAWNCCCFEEKCVPLPSEILNLKLLTKIYYFMKKTFFYLFAIFCCFAMCLVSCEKPQTGGGGEDDELEDVVLPEGTIRLQALTSQYGSGPDMGYSNASHNFLLMFATEDCEVIEGEPFGNGDILVFELFSESAENILPAEGIYPIKDMEPIEDGMIVGGFDVEMGTPFGSYIQHMENDEFVGWDLVTGGAMEIKKTKKDGVLEFYIYTINEDGTEGYYYYRGKLLIENLSAIE